MIKQFLWRALAYLVSRPRVADYLIERAKRTPYTNITSPNGDDVYMERYWLFNPYPADEAERERRKLKPTLWDKLPSARIHCIRREDRDRHHHDHPWDARTVILKGWYNEARLEDGSEIWHARNPGDTVTLNYGEYHRIFAVPSDGVWTLFITWKYQGTWGFLVDGVKVPWRQYLGLRA